MKHTWKATLIILVLFLLTQLIGLAVVKTYTVGWQIEKTVVVDGVPTEVAQNLTKPIPFGFEPPEVQPEISMISIIIAILIATFVILLLGKIKANFIIKLWFTFVVLMTSAVALAAAIPALFAIAIAAVLTYFKIFRRHLIVHNLTELLIYPGLAAIFVPILNIGMTILLLIFLSFYDFYAVFKSKHMIKLAKYQMEELKVFTGFFLPYMKKGDWKKIQKMKQIEKSKVRGKKSKLKALGQKIKVNIAMLGGGDVAFPLIFAGVVLKTYNSFFYGTIIAVFATLSLLYLLMTAKKGKFYPAMPFITVGCLIGYGFVWLLNSLM